MSKNIENIDRYLRNVNLPENVPHQHRDKLRRQVLGKIEKRQTMSGRSRAWKVAAVVIVMIGAGAIATAVGLKVRQYYFVGRGADGRYIFRMEPEIVNVGDGRVVTRSRVHSVGSGPPDPNHTIDVGQKIRDLNDIDLLRHQDARVGMIVIDTEANVKLRGTFRLKHILANSSYLLADRSYLPDPNHTIDVEQKIRDLEEIDLLRQQDARELVGVVETEVNGHLHRTFRFKYVLADGRETTIGESDPDKEDRRSPEQIEKDFEEIAHLREQGERELVRVIDTQVEGDLHRVCVYKYVLADGRELTVGGEADPEFLNFEQILEVGRLRLLKQGDFLGYDDRDVQGKTFNFETYIFTLSDGTVVTHAIGGPKGHEKTWLTEADWEELSILLVQSVQSEEGEDLGIEEKEIRGRIFVFERKLYILSDGTEVIWSDGKPK